MFIYREFMHLMSRGSSLWVSKLADVTYYGWMLGNSYLVVYLFISMPVW